MKLKYTKTTLSKLEQIFKESDYTIRYEKGQFKAGYCLIYKKKIIVINKFFDNKGRIESLLDILSEVKIDESNMTEASFLFYSNIFKSLTPPEKMVA